MGAKTPPIRGSEERLTQGRGEERRPKETGKGKKKKKFHD